MFYVKDYFQAEINKISESLRSTNVNKGSYILIGLIS